MEVNILHKISCYVSWSRNDESVL